MVVPTLNTDGSRFRFDTASAYSNPAINEQRVKGVIALRVDARAYDFNCLGVDALLSFLEQQAEPQVGARVPCMSGCGWRVNINK